MARRPLRTALVLACLLAAGFSLVTRRNEPPARLDGGDPSLLADRLWLQAIPTAPTQHVHAFLILADAPFGIFQKSSAYQATLEVFEHIRDGGDLRLRFPQSGAATAIRFRVSGCATHPPFDLCLELSANPWGGPTRYFGFRDEDGVGASHAALRHRLAHAAVDGP
jgi:hypothetical protein